MKLIKELGLRESSTIRNNKPRKFSWGLYECPICYTHFEYNKGKMKGSAPKSCGCLVGEKHGDWKSSLYGVWKSMKQRCTLKSHTSYKYYGAKGVTTCKEWQGSYMAFKKWAYCNGYEEGLSIDRLNPEGNYEPVNCKWSTKTEQARNTRKLRATNTSGYRGVCWDKRDGKWRATITVDNQQISLGYHESKFAAAKAYDTYVVQHGLEHTVNGVLHENNES